MTDLTDDQKEAIEWIRSRPANVQELMLRFPPSCTVRTVEGVCLLVPSPGTTGRINRYWEIPDGTLQIVVLQGEIEAACRPDHLEVVGYFGNITPEFIQRVLAGEDLAVELASAVE